MFKQVFKYTLIAYGWKRYRRLIISALVLFGYFWLVATIHNDFIAYSNLNDSRENIALSFIVKWLAYGLGVVVFWLFNVWRRRMQDAKATDVEQALLTKKTGGKTASTDTASPFDEIRRRKKLRSRAELIIENKVKK